MLCCVAGNHIIMTTEIIIRWKFASNIQFYPKKKHTRAVCGVAAARARERTVKRENNLQFSRIESMIHRSFKVVASSWAVSACSHFTGARAVCSFSFFRNIMASE